MEFLAILAGAALSPHPRWCPALRPAAKKVVAGGLPSSIRPRPSRPLLGRMDGPGCRSQGRARCRGRSPRRSRRNHRNHPTRRSVGGIAGSLVDEPKIVAFSQLRPANLPTRLPVRDRALHAPIVAYQSTNHQSTILRHERHLPSSASDHRPDPLASSNLSPHSPQSAASWSTSSCASRASPACRCVLRLVQRRHRLRPGACAPKS